MGKNLNEEDLGSAYTTYVGGVQKEVEANKQAITDAYNALKIQAADKLNADKIAAQNAYERSLSTYGSQAEALRSRGFTTGQQGGYSTFLDASANMAKQKAITDLDKAYQSLVADLGVKESDELRTEDAKVTTAETTYNTNKLKAYAGILENAGLGTYMSQGGVDNAIAAYESLYGKMGEDQRTSIQKAYETTLVESGDVIAGDEYAALPEGELKKGYLNNFTTKMGEVVKGALDANNADELLTEIDAISKYGGTEELYNKLGDALNKYAMDFGNVTADNEEAVNNFRATIGNVLRQTTDATAKAKLIDALTRTFHTGGDFYEADRVGYYNKISSASTRRDAAIRIDGYSYQFSVKIDTQPDADTTAILDSLGFGLNNEKNLDSDGKRKSIAIIYGGALYVYYNKESGKEGWKKCGLSNNEVNRANNVKTNYNQ